MSNIRLQSYEEPHEDAVADRALYARLQREAQAREDAALYPPPAPYTPAINPQYVDGRWVVP